MTSDAGLQPAVAAEFQALADLLDSATEAQWDVPSLCAGWRVREVIAAHDDEEVTAHAG